MLSPRQFHTDMAKAVGMPTVTFSLHSRPTTHTSIPAPPRLPTTTNHFAFYKVRGEEKLAHPVRVQSRVISRPFRRTGYSPPPAERPVQPPSGGIHVAAAKYSWR